MFDRTSFSSVLAECECRNKQSDPFYFPIRNQRVMLITACPSLQTVSSTLTSVRFVRQVLYALLGEEGVSDDGLSLLFSKKGIYWCHLHKCFNEKFYNRDQDGKYKLQDLPLECAGRYLKNETELLYKSLKLIIVMGKQTCRNAATYMDEMRNKMNAIGEQIEIIEIDYMQYEIPEKYDALQKKVAGALGREVPENHADPKLLETAKTRMRVGIDMELAVLEKFFNTEDTEDHNSKEITSIPNKLDQMWLDSVALPQKKRQAMLITAWSTIESFLTAFLIDALDPRSQKAIAIHSKEWLQNVVNRSRNGIYINKEPDFRSLSAIITNIGELWLMDRLVKFLKSEIVSRVCGHEILTNDCHCGKIVENHKGA